MTRSTVFRNNTTQAVRLPKDVALPQETTHVEVTVVGRSRLITPVGSGWEHWFEHAPAVSEDFGLDRDQPPTQQRPGL